MMSNSNLNSVKVISLDGKRVSSSEKGRSAPTEKVQKNFKQNEIFKRILEEDDFKGFEMLHRHYFEMLCNFGMRFVNSKEDSKDLVSDVFYNLWKNRKKINIETSCRAYLFTAVRNRAYNFLNRKAKRYTSIEDTGFVIRADGANADRSLLTEELSEKIVAAINLLPPQCHKVFTLSRYEGKKNREIGKLLNISNKAVEANMTRALKSLKHSLRCYLPIFILIYVF